MTEQPEPERRARKPRPLPTVMAALAIFGVAFEFLAFQLSSGKDPAVGLGTSARTPVTRTRPAKKIVITKVIPAGATVGGAAPSHASAGSVPGPAPVTSSSS